ncbi:MAG: hypothetical protein ABI654_12165 [Betaproteobacteria bacterium]
MALAPKVNTLVMERSGSEDWRTRRAQLQVEVEHFVSGGKLRIALPNADDPSEDKEDANLRLLHKWSDEVWEIRSKMDPQIRIFGSFAGPDYFVALCWEFRCKLGKYPWEITESCKQSWHALFPQFQPFTGKKINDYITKNGAPC